MAEVQSGRFYGIEVLRFFAAAIVVFTHSTFYAFERNDPSTRIWHFGEAGVDIFFVISGFVIVLASRRNGHWVSAGYFASRRLLRIVPMYWLATSINVLILLAAPNIVLHSNLNWTEIAKSYFLYPEYNQDGRIEPLLGVAWTLYFETFFYAVVGTALLLRLSPFLFTSAVLLGAVLLSFFKTPEWPPIFVYANPIILEFLAGMIIATRAADLRIGKVQSFLLLASGVTLLVLLGEYFSYLHPVLYRGVPSILIVAGVVATERFVPWQRVSWLIYLGAASYAIYLFHPIFAPAAPVLLNALGIHNGVTSTILSIVVALIVSVAIHATIERPLMGLFLAKRTVVPRDGIRAKNTP